MKARVPLFDDSANTSHTSTNESTPTPHTPTGSSTSLSVPLSPLLTLPLPLSTFSLPLSGRGSLPFPLLRSRFTLSTPTSSSLLYHGPTTSTLNRMFPSPTRPTLSACTQRDSSHRVSGIIRQGSGRV